MVQIIYSTIVYVGDEAGLAGYEGEVKDMQGRFIIPGLMDSLWHRRVNA